MKRALPLVLAFLSLPAWATTYYFAGGVYTTRYAHQTCGTGTCADYPAGGRVTGSFTTAAPLAANQPSTEITGSVTSYSFSDGLHTYANADASARIVAFSIATGASGAPSSATIQLQLWQAAAPHNAGNDRLDILLVGTPTGAGTNVTCSAFGASPANGVADVCTAYSGSTDTSQAITSLAGTWSVDVPIVLPPATPTTYHVASGPYTTRFPHTTCGTGACADYPLAARITGSFTTADALPANLAAIDVSGLVTAYSFGDGVHTYASGDANARIATFQVATDAGGVPSMQSVVLQQWQAPAPHNAGNARLNLMQIAGSAGAGTNATCASFGTSPAGAADACLAYSGSSDTSQAVSVLPTRTAIGAPLPLSLTPATYAYTGTAYTTIANHSSCTTGACADYASNMRVTGTFTLADRLPANFGPADFSGLVSAYSFSDGVHAIASAQPLARIVQFTLQTDAGGVPVSSQIGLEQWQAAPPHPAGSRLDMIGVSTSGSSAGINVDCTTDGASSPGTGTPDSCLNPATVTDTSLAVAEGGGWAAVPAASSAAATPVPALAREGRALLAIALLALAAVALRRRSAA